MTDNSEVKKGTITIEWERGPDGVLGDVALEPDPALSEASIREILEQFLSMLERE